VAFLEDVRADGEGLPGDALDGVAPGVQLRLDVLDEHASESFGHIGWRPLIGL
jgi:hypothetical protein